MYIKYNIGEIFGVAAKSPEFEQIRFLNPLHLQRRVPHLSVTIIGILRKQTFLSMN